jgi:hypothetical protein
MQLLIACAATHDVQLAANTGHTAAGARVLQMHNKVQGTSTRAHSFRQEANIDRWCSDTEESMAGGR